MLFDLNLTDCRDKDEHDELFITLMVNKLPALCSAGDHEII